MIQLCDRISKVPVRERIRKAYRSITSPVVEKPQRMPVTQNFMASFMASQEQGEKVSHPAQHCFSDALHASIERLVYKLCAKYAVTCPSDIDDLVQNCCIRIHRRISTYDSNKSQFSTWCWKVCTSTLNSDYRYRQRRKSNCVPLDEIENLAEDNVHNARLGMDIVEAIKQLVDLHPQKRHIIIGLFGDPNASEFHLPADVQLSATARVLGVSYNEVSVFYKNVVKKFFREKFQHEMGVA